MHFFAFEDRSLLYRRNIENFFRIVNKAVWAVQLSCALIGMILLVIAAEEMFTESPMAIGARLTLTANFRAMFANCTTVTSVDTFLLEAVPFRIDDGNVEFLLALYANKVLTAIVVAAFAVIVSLVNKVLYDFNLFFLRKEYLIVRKDVVSAVELMLLCGSIGANANAHDFAAPLLHHVAVCGRGTVTSSKNFLKPSNFAPLYVAACLPLFVHFVCFCLLAKYTLVDAAVAPPPTEEQSASNEADEPMPVAAEQAPPRELGEIEREQRILDRRAAAALAASGGAGGAGGAGSQQRQGTIAGRAASPPLAIAGMVDSPSRGNGRPQRGLAGARAVTAAALAVGAMRPTLSQPRSDGPFTAPTDGDAFDPSNDAGQ